MARTHSQPRVPPSAVPRKSASDAALAELRAFGLAYPGAHTKSPWPGHLDLAVNDKTFAYLSIEGEPFSISCKLPQSSEVALMLPFAKPTAYGLGKSGWVSATPPPGTAAAGRHVQGVDRRELSRAGAEEARRSARGSGSASAEARSDQEDRRHEEERGGEEARGSTREVGVGARPRARHEVLPVPEASLHHPRMIAFLGTGLLGTGFVRAARKRGEDVQVWNRTAEKARALEADGARAFADPAAAMRGRVARAPRALRRRRGRRGARSRASGSRRSRRHRSHDDRRKLGRRPQGAVARARRSVRARAGVHGPAERPRLRPG